MSALAVRAELDKLGATLDLDPERLAFLGDLPAEELRSIRVAIYERIFTRDRPAYRRLARIASWLPPRLAARLGERAMGPEVTARVAAELTSARTLAAAREVSTSFLADVCVHLDPRRTREFIRALPREQVVETAVELTGRGDHMTISRFVDFFDDETLRAGEDAIADEADLLRIAFYMGSKSHLDHLFRLLPPERLERMIVRVQEQPDELLPPFMSLLTHVSYGLKRDLGDLAARQPDEVLTGFVTAGREQELWSELLPVIAAMSEGARRRMVNLPVLARSEVQRSILRAAGTHRMWGIVLSLIALIEQEGTRDAIASILGTEPRSALAGAAEAALMGEQWETLLDLVRRMPADRQEAFAEIVAGFGSVDPGLVRRIAAGAEQRGLQVSAERFLTQCFPAGSTQVTPPQRAPLAGE